MASLPGLLKQGVAAALGAVAADGKEDMNVASDKVVDSGCHIDRASRSSQYCSAVVMYLIYKCGRYHRRFRAARGVKALVTASEPEHLCHSVGMMEFVEECADHVV